TSRDMVSQAAAFLAAIAGWNGLTGRVLQRRALLVSPGGPVNTALRRCRQLLRSTPGNRRGGPQIGYFRPRPPGIGLVLARGTAPAALPEPGRRAARRDPQNRHRKDHDK